MADAATALKGLATRLRRAYWLMGNAVVREEFVNAVGDRVGAAPQDRVSVSVRDDGFGAVTDQLSSYALDPDAPRFVRVRDAEYLPTSAAAWLDGWLDTKTERTNPRCHAVFISGREEWEPDKWRKGVDDPYRPALRLLFAGGNRSTTQLVDCTFAETDKGRDLMRELILLWAPGISDSAAIHILVTSGWDMREARDAARKVAVCSRVAPLTDLQVGKLVRPMPAMEYAHSVLALDKRSALEVVPYLPEDSEAFIIGRLEYDLDVLGRLNTGQRAGDSDYALQTRMNIHRVVIERLRPLAKHYDPPQILRRSELLLAMEPWGMRRGYPAGVLELIAARW